MPYAKGTTVYVQDVIDLVNSAKKIGVTIDTLLIPATEFVEFKEQLEAMQKDTPDKMKELAGVRMLQHYPMTIKYNACADKMDTIMEFYRKTISDKHDVESKVYNYFDIDREQLAREQKLLKQNLGKTDEECK